MHSMPVSYNTNCVCFVIRLKIVRNFDLLKLLIFTGSTYRACVRVCFPFAGEFALYNLTSDLTCIAAPLCHSKFAISLKLLSQKSS